MTHYLIVVNTSLRDNPNYDPSTISITVRLARDDKDQAVWDAVVYVLSRLPDHNALSAVAREDNPYSSQKTHYRVLESFEGLYVCPEAEAEE